ncbi:MAG: ATP-dependent helicase [Eubacteriales bacterium]|nr:ATP-dependent helicase [Eubacteriales bacterium]
MQEFKSERIIQLDEQQRAALQNLEGSSLLLAVPGSGKTTTLLARLEAMLCQGISESQILVITYTNNAAEEMRRRFRRQYGENRVDFMTINSFCYRLILYYSEKTGRQKPEDVVDTGKILRRIFRQVTREPFPVEGDIREFAQKITYIKNMQLPESEIAKLRVGNYPAAPLYQAYVETMKQMNGMDFDDQLVYAYKFLRNVPGVRNHYRKKYPYVMVDEAQDTSWLQHEILKLLIGDTGNLFMVGDEDQSIYGFRAAYPEALLDFGKNYPGGRIFRLETNYRSGRDIVALADRFIRRNTKRYDKTMRPALAASGRVRVEPVPRRADQYPKVIQWISQELEKETAILYRNNDSAIPLMYHLQKAGISFRSRGLDTLFFGSHVLRDAKDILGFALHPADSELFWRIYYKLNYRIPKNAVADAVQRMDMRDPDPILSILVRSPLMGRQKKEDLEMLRDNLREIRQRDDAKQAIRMIRRGLRYRNESSEKLFVMEALAEPGESISEYLQKLRDLEYQIEQGGESTDGNVILSTVHGSKGLEYDRVILLDGVRNVLPSSDGDYAEERRIYYVAMTRAREELILPDYGDCESPFLRECFGRLPKEKPQPMDSKEFREKAEEFQVGVKVKSRNFGIGEILSRKDDLIEVYFPQDDRTRKFVLQICIEKGSLQPA